MKLCSFVCLAGRVIKKITIFCFCMSNWQGAFKNDIFIAANSRSATMSRNKNGWVELFYLQLNIHKDPTVGTLELSLFILVFCKL